MQLLRSPSDYASAGNYVAPTKAWDGLSRISYPTPSQQNAGATPDTAINAELENGRNKILFDAQCVQIHDALKFTRTDLVVGTTTINKLSAVQQTGGIGSPTSRPKSILVSGVTAGGLYVDALLNDGTNPPAAFSSLAGSAPNSAPASDPLGLIFVGVGSGTTIIKSADGGVTPATQAVTGLTTGAAWVGATGSRYLVFERSTNKLYITTNIAGAWSNIATIFDIISDLVTDGAGTWVLIGQQVGGVVTTLRSTDDGATWGSSSSTIYSATGVGGCWSDEWQMFVLIDGNGKMYTSSTGGVSWTLQRTMAGLNGLTFGQHTVAASGCAVACIVNRAVNSLGKSVRGIAYTLDHGATWFDEYIGDSTAANPRDIANLIAANGRFYAVDGGSLFMSGVLAAPVSMFTGV